ncbi:GFA family protein [Marinicaulis aureus]|uniref:GFA family protein n=1 Tax=Hyphococcus aureus TaxID=2666033 RepID=A0ABW1KY96_9PROT
MIYNGQCHCGKLKASFETEKTPEALGVRTCQCAFCRAHGAINISDPEGITTIDCAPENVRRYTFALRTADFLLCKNCGVYIAAVMGEGERIVSTLNVVGLSMKEFLDIAEAPMEYGAETTEKRIGRRFEKWTPTRFANPDLAAANFGPHDVQASA